MTLTYDDLIECGLTTEQVAKLAQKMAMAAATDENEAGANGADENEAGVNEADENEAGVNGTDVDETDVNGTEEEATIDEIETLRQKLMNLMVDIAAMAAGVRQERTAVIRRLADVSGIDPVSEDAGQQVKAAVQAVLEEIPELAQRPATGGLGAHPRQTAQADDPFARGLAGI